MKNLDYIEHDHFTLFYCLFFAIFFNNPDIVPFLSEIINYLKSRNKSQKEDEQDLNNWLLGNINMYGIDLLRAQADKTSQIVYHRVFYKAIDDQIRVVYSMIMNSLKAIMLRDKDGFYLLAQRDYKLIKKSFELKVVMLNPNQVGMKPESLICKGYRQYN